MCDQALDSEEDSDKSPQNLKKHGKRVNLNDEDPIIAQLLNPSDDFVFPFRSEEKDHADLLPRDNGLFENEWLASQNDCGDTTNRHKIPHNNSEEGPTQNRYDGKGPQFSSRRHDKVRIKLENIFSQCSDSPKVNKVSKMKITSKEYSCKNKRNKGKKKRFGQAQKQSNEEDKEISPSQYKSEFKLSNQRPYVFKRAQRQGRDRRNPMFGPAKLHNNVQTKHFNGHPGKKKYNNSYPEKNSYQEGESTLFSGFSFKN
ncbi:unnamed protein product [Moneuplotes crassus]|uniref:Uncharacterized protein n=1 Tax=Euplotes crassus TaxID=5936 RepID=A0AAD1XQQ1_EUPCR|nr:unnamed protein product [Moneuplotes crassus]